MFVFRTHLAETLIALVLLFLVIEHISRKQVRLKDETPGLLPTRIWLVTFLTRYTYCSFVGDKISQRNDFLITLSEASSGIFTDQLEYYRQYAHKLIYPFVLHLVGFRSQKSILFLQCVLAAFVSIALYMLANEVIGKEGAVFAASLYVLWPGQLFYAAVVSEEHVAALLTILLILFLLRLCIRIENSLGTGRETAMIMLQAAGIGVLFGLSCFFKDWGAVILVATLISSVWLFFRLGDYKRKLVLATVLLLIFMARFGVSSGVLALAGARLGVPVGNNVIVAQMFTTLDPDTDGEYNEEGNEEYYAICKKHGYDFKTANREAMHLLWERIRAGHDKMPGLLLKKGSTAYTDDASMLYWAFVVSAKDDETFQLYRGLIQLLWFLAAIYYCVMVISFLGGGIIKPDRNKFFILLIILGGILVSLLIESHGRYKYSIEPIWCVPAAGFFVQMQRYIGEKTK